MLRFRLSVIQRLGSLQAPRGAICSPHALSPARLSTPGLTHTRVPASCHTLGPTHRFFSVQPEAEGEEEQSLEERRRALRQKRLAARKLRGLDVTVRGEQSRRERTSAGAGMAQEQLKSSKTGRFDRGYITALVIAGLLAGLYQSRHYWSESVMRLIFKFMDLNDNSTWPLTYLPYLAMLDREAATEHFTANEALALNQLLDMANQSDDLETQKAALMVLQALVQPGNPPARRRLIASPGFVDKLLAIIPATGADVEACQTALQIVYFCVEEGAFFNGFVKADGFRLFCRGARATNPEIQGFFMHLMGLFLMSHPSFLKGKIKALGTGDLNAVWASLTNLGAGYQDGGQSKLAVQAYKQALEVDPMNPGILTQLAVELQKLGRMDEATQYMKRSLDIDPMQVETAYNIARRCVEKDPTDKQGLKNAVETLVGGIEEVRKGVIQGAAASSGMLVHPVASKAFSLIVSCLEKLGNEESALDYALEWALRCHTDPMAHFAYGRLLNRQGEYHEALTELDVAISQHPTHPAYHYQRCAVLHKLGKTGDAIEACRTSLDMHDGLVHQVAKEKKAALKAAAYRAANQKKKKKKKKKTPASTTSTKFDETAGGRKESPRESEEKLIEKRFRTPAVPVPCFRLLAKLLWREGQGEEALHVAEGLVERARASEQRRDDALRGSDGSVGAFCHEKAKLMQASGKDASPAYEDAVRYWSVVAGRSPSATAAATETPQTETKTAITQSALGRYFSRYPKERSAFQSVGTVCNRTQATGSDQTFAFCETHAQLAASMQM